MDYTAILTKVKAMLQKHGKQITLSSIDSSTADINKPWLSVANPRDPNNTTSTTVYAIGVPLAFANSLGIHFDSIELIKSTKSVFIAEPGSDTPEDLNQYQLVTDDSKESRITFVEKLKPAGLTLLYFIGAEN